MTKSLFLRVDYISSIITVTICHKFSGLEGRRFILKLKNNYKTRGQKKVVGRSDPFLEALWENPFLPFSSFFRLPVFLGSWLATTPSLKPEMTDLSHATSLWRSLFSILHPSLKHFMITLGHVDHSGQSSCFKVSWLVTIIPSAILFLPYHETLYTHRLWGLVWNLFGGGHYSVYIIELYLINVKGMMQIENYHLA